MIVKIVIVLLMLLTPYTLFIGITCLGGLLEGISNGIKSICKNKRIAIIPFIVMLILVSGMQNIISNFLKINYLHINEYWELFYAMSMLTCIYSSQSLLTLFDKWHLDKLTQLSMIIYLIHQPIICSFSTKCFITLLERIDHFFIYYFGTLGITIIVLAIVVYLYDNVFGKLSNIILRKVTF